ncbi:MAG: hypothetical protein RBR38_16770 [Desulfomicrobium apsheronum]|nr:hypothetical protein [Desulfomicrobium apsheronum]
MGYEIIAFGTCGETICTLETHDEDHRAAHAVMGALGVDYNYLDQAGPGDTMKFNAGELHAAQAALTVAVNVEEEFTRGMVLLESALEYMKENELSEIEIGFF